MQLISDLVNLWLEQSLGPIPAFHPLLSYPTSTPKCPTPSSWIWELDESMGKILGLEGHKRSWLLLRRIGRVVGHLSARYQDWKMSSDQHASLALTDDQAHWQVIRILADAEAPQSTAGVSASIISLSALLTCFASNRGLGPISARRANDMIKCCAAIALQLRKAYVSTTSMGNEELTGGSGTSTASLWEAMNDDHMALTMIEAMTGTFEFLLAHAGFVAPSDVVHGSSERLSDEAKQVVGGKLGVIMGILCTITDYFDHMPKREQRAGRISQLLRRLQKRLEDLQVQADVSFALDYSLSSRLLESAQWTSNSREKEAARALVSSGTMAVHCSPISPLEPAAAHSEATAFSTMETGPIHGDFSTTYPSAADMYPNETQRAAGHLGYGPGPIPMGRNGPGEASMASNATRTSGAFCWDGRSSDQARSSRCFEQVRLTTNEVQAFPAAFEANMRGATPMLPFGQGMSESTQSCASGGSNVREMQSCVGGWYSSVGTDATQYVADEYSYASYTAQEDFGWARHESQYVQYAHTDTWRNAYETTSVEPRMKRARVDVDVMRHFYSTSRQVSEGDVSSAATHSKEALTYGHTMAAIKVETFRDMAMSQSTLDGKMPAAEALASLQGMEPMTDEVRSGTWAGSDWTTIKGPERERREESFSAKIVSLSEEEVSEKEEEKGTEEEDEGDDGGRACETAAEEVGT